MIIKTPVRYCSEDWMIFDADDQWIASFDAGDVGPQVALILNSHAGLLAVCVKMVNDERFYKNDYSHFTCLACGNTGNKPLLIRHTEWCLIGEGHAAIAKAKGDQC